MLLRFLIKCRFVRWVNFWRQFFKLKTQGVPVMTLRMAARIGIRDIWHLNKGVGDALMFAGASREYHKKTGVRPLLFVPQHQVFLHCDFCWFLFDWKFQNIPDTNNTFEVFYKLFQEQKNGKPLCLRNGYKFNLVPLEYMKSCYVIGNIFQKLYGGFPRHGQIVQWVGNRMGIVGDIDVKPELRLMQYEKDFGKFAAGKIIIKCGGNGPYKYLTHKIAQGIVDSLKHKYDFLQIGDFGDPVIADAENLFKLNIRELAGVLHHARLFVGAIGGMMHLARAVDCPAVILHGCEHDDFYYPSQRKVFSENRCMLCVQNCWWPDKDDERRCPRKYRCITDFDVKKVTRAIEEELSKSREIGAKPDIFTCVGRMVDCRCDNGWWLTLDDFILKYQVPTKADKANVKCVRLSFEYALKIKDGYTLPTMNNMVISSLRNLFSHRYNKEIYSDNPFIIRLKPQPSFFAYIGKISDMYDKLTVDWNTEEVLDDTDYWLTETVPKPEYSTLKGFARANHMMNFLLWHTKDITRRRDVSPEVIMDVNRRIDMYNQRRNYFAERLDETLIMMLMPRLPGATKAPLNTESLGIIMDRLSILSLKIYHMREQSSRRSVRKECLKKLNLLEEQKMDLLESVKFLITDFINGAKRPKVYYQLKMYNNSNYR